MFVLCESFTCTKLSQCHFKTQHRFCSHSRSGLSHQTHSGMVRGSCSTSSYKLSRWKLMIGIVICLDQLPSRLAHVRNKSTTCSSPNVRQTMFKSIAYTTNQPTNRPTYRKTDRTTDRPFCYQTNLHILYMAAQMNKYSTNRPEVLMVSFFCISN